MISTTWLRSWVAVSRCLSRRPAGVWGHQDDFARFHEPGALATGFSLEAERLWIDGKSGQQEHVGFTELSGIPDMVEQRRKALVVLPIQGGPRERRQSPVCYLLAMSRGTTTRERGGNGSSSLSLFCCCEVGTDGRRPSCFVMRYACINVSVPKCLSPCVLQVVHVCGQLVGVLPRQGLCSLQCLSQR